MRKFLPRLFNTIAFLLIISLILPWQNIGNFITAKLGTITVFAAVGAFFTNYEWVKLAVIPAIVVLISFAYFITSMIDRGMALHNKKTSKPIKNAVYEPIYFFGIVCAFLGGFASLILGKAFTVNATDWFGLGTIVSNLIGGTISLTKWIGLGIYALLFVVQILLALFATKKLHTRGFVGRFLMYLVFLALALLSYKGLVASFTLDSVDTIQAFLATFSSAAASKEYLASYVTYTYKVNLALFILLGLAAVSLILYIIIGSVQCHKTNAEMKSEDYNNYLKTKQNKEEKKAAKEQAKKEKQEKKNEVIVPEKAEVSEGQVQAKPLENGEVEDPLFVLPTPEQIVQPQQGEAQAQVGSNQVIFENCDLDKIYNTEFGFKYCTMVRKDGYTEYFVNKQKFLTLSNGNRTMSFRLELDKAIRLILQYPLIGKDKYENHKIWFKVEDSSILNNDTVVSIIKDAYNTVINNE